MSTPPRIRGLVDGLERAVRMEIYAKRDKKRERKNETLKAKLALLRAFSILSHGETN